jgi:hypothetical protein
MASLGVRIPLSLAGDGISEPIEPRPGFKFLVRGFGAEAPPGTSGGVVFSRTPDTAAPLIVEELAELTSVTFPAPLIIPPRSPVYIVVVDSSVFTDHVLITLDHEVQPI